MCRWSVSCPFYRLADVAGLWILILPNFGGRSSFAALVRVRFYLFFMLLGSQAEGETKVSASLLRNVFCSGQEASKATYTRLRYLLIQGASYCV